MPTGVSSRATAPRSRPGSPIGPNPSVPGVTHRDVEVNGVRLHVAEAGAGPPLVLLRGCPPRWWPPPHLTPALARTRHVLAPDLRGSARSAAPSGDYAKQTLADDLLA